jgi:hypothetical protein
MDAIYPAIHALYETPLATSIRESEWTFPVLQTFHIIGAIALVDLRIAGLAFRSLTAGDAAKALLPLAWGAFVVTAISGGFLFAAQAEKIYTNIFLLTKFALIALAGLNLILFHAGRGRAIATWGADGGSAPASVRAGALASLLLWTGVVVCGRFIAYF